MYRDLIRSVGRATEYQPGPIIPGRPETLPESVAHEETFRNLNTLSLGQSNASTEVCIAGLSPDVAAKVPVGSAEGTDMTKNLMRRLERLEQRGSPAWQTRLRAFARKLAFDEEEFLAIVKGHERQLAEHVDEDGRITWEGFQLLYSLLPPARRSSRVPRAVGTPRGGEPR